MQLEAPVPLVKRISSWPISASGYRVLAEDAVKIGDVVAVASAGVLTTAWRFGGQSVPDVAFAALIIGCLLTVNVFSFCQVYEVERLRSIGTVVPRLLLGWAATIMVLIAVLYSMKIAEDLSRLWIGVWFITGAVALVIGRTIASVVMTRGELSEALTRQVAVVGSGERLTALVARLSHNDPTFRISAVLDLDGPKDTQWPPRVSVLTGLADLEARICSGGIDQVLLAMPPCSSDLLERTLRSLRHLPVEVSWMLDMIEVGWVLDNLPSARVPKRGFAHVGNLPIVRLVERPLDGWRYVLKSIEDQVLAAAILVLVAPVMLLIAAAVKLDSPGPVLYRQQRRGFSRQPITMLKFRTMYAHRCDAPDADVVKQATRDDERVTRVGRFLRRTSLDELPQLFNVLRGEMSIVGPRPHAVAHDSYYSDLVDDYLGRHRVKPGITGWAQVHGCRGETHTVEAMRKRIEFDLEYIDKWSLWFDIRILCRTLLIGFSDPNAY